MKMIMCPLSSGSSGNCTLVAFDNRRILVDAGISATKITNALREIGLTPADIQGIVITHEHIDHVRGIPVFCRKYGVPVFANAGTWAGIMRRDSDIPYECRYQFETGANFYVGDVSVFPFSIPHDANEPVGFTMDCGGMRCAVATDIGHINEEWIRAVSGASALLLESNHDVEMVRNGPYPYHLKQRILSRRGHLCNEDCARALIALYPTGVQAVFLGHLSGENNLPELAHLTVKTRLEEAGIDVDRDLFLRVARRDGISDMIVLEG